MRKASYFLLGCVFFVGGLGLLAVFFLPKRPASSHSHQTMATTSPITLTSLAFADNGMIPQKYACTGDNMSPPLAFGALPAAAKSLALIVDDPDAPGGTWVHWVAFNISTSTKEVPEGAGRAGTSGMGSAGSLEYEGPCPPSGTHHYFFKLYALDAMLDLPAASAKADLEAAMRGHIVGEGVLVGLYAHR